MSTAVVADNAAGEPNSTSPSTGSGLPAPDRAELFAWMDHAACRGVGTTAFFSGHATMAQAKACCAACPVQEICLYWAMVVEDDLGGYRVGIWGGVGPAVRARIAWAAGPTYARARFITTATRWARTSFPPADTAAVA